MTPPDITVIEQDRSGRVLPKRSEWLRTLAPWLLAPSVFALAYFSPVEHVDSDPAIALLVAQSLLDHHTWRLDAYRDDPACAYNLERDYRIRRREGSYYYYAHGVSLLSLPAVWLANRAGYHMLDQGDEFALQNLLSALSCTLLGLLLYRICGAYVGPAASLTVVSVSLLGSSLSSTLATGLWNAVYEILFLALGLLHMVRRETSGTAQPSRGYLALLAALAFLCRPTAAFAILAAILAFIPATAMRSRRNWLLATLVLLVIVVLFGIFGAAEWLPQYYSPRKLVPRTPLLTGLCGVLLSPSRGLLIFSPFLMLVAAGCARLLPALAGNRLFRLAAVWTGLHLLAISTKGNWWGGHSYGPRLLTEVMLPAVLLTCLAWRLLETRSRPRTRVIIAAAYLACGLVAVFIHSYQGLFNPHTRRWNWTPDIDRNPRLAFDWNHPQFLATDSSLEDRVFELERLELGTYTLGRRIAFNGEALFRDWYTPEEGWRWSRGNSPEILFRLGDLPSRGPYLLGIRAASLGRQKVGLVVNGTGVGSIDLDGGVRERAFTFERDLLRPGRENSFRFDLPGATSTATDSRVMGLALHNFRIYSLPSDFDGIDFDGVAGDGEPFFVLGFSSAERAWRWTDGRRAVIHYPVGGTDGLDTLVLEASVLDHQPVGIKINGIAIGELSFEGEFDTVVARRLTFDNSLLRPFRMNHIELALPQAHGTADDARLLGLAFVRLELRRATPAGVDP